MKALLVAITAFFTCWSVLPASDAPNGRSSFGLLSAAPLRAIPVSAALSHEGTGMPPPGDLHTPREDLQFSLSPMPNMLALPDQALDRKETRFRRFEIVFFTSLPASVILSLLGVIAFRNVAGNTGDFSAVEYRYLALSTIGMSLGIAASDLKNTGIQKSYRRGHR